MRPAQNQGENRRGAFQGPLVVLAKTFRREIVGGTFGKSPKGAGFESPGRAERSPGLQTKNAPSPNGSRFQNPYVAASIRRSKQDVLYLMFRTHGGRRCHRKRQNPRMAWQPHGWKRRGGKQAVIFCYPWDCHAIRGTKNLCDRWRGTAASHCSIEGISPRWGFRVDDSMLPRAERPGLSNLAPLGLVQAARGLLDRQFGICAR